MRPTFPLFQSHLDLAHHNWARRLCPNDIVIDATCGNGHDALALAQLVIPKKGAQSPLLHIIDIQENAIDSGYRCLEQQLTAPQMKAIHWYSQSHAELPTEKLPGPVSAVIYNLGYLPGGDKTVTTMTESTLPSLMQAIDLVKPGGFVSITCYPGHEAGYIEEVAILDWTHTLDRKEYSCCHHQWTNRPGAPSLFLIQRAIP
ncbi:Putative rRNA methylase YtqB [Chlamydiales bacterium SCGC AG-110-P3]|nr:Putative rRNA methylase YtqB [Chlamydiales bacterium SCGC AG-110-P3]